MVCHITQPATAPGSVTDACPRTSRAVASLRARTRRRFPGYSVIPARAQGQLSQKLKTRKSLFFLQYSSLSANNKALLSVLCSRDIALITSDRKYGIK